MQSSIFFKTQRPGRPLKKAGRPSRRTCTNIDTCIIFMHLLLARTNIRFHSRNSLELGRVAGRNWARVASRLLVGSVSGVVIIRAQKASG
jgi:hypothetical protein